MKRGARWPRRGWGTPLLAAALAMAGPDTALADAFGAEVALLAVHVQSERDAPAAYYPRRLDEAGQVVFTPGVELYYDHVLESPLAGAAQWRLTAGRFRDSADREFGYYAAMARWRLHRRAPFTVSLHLGPGLIFRRSWSGLPGYRNSGLLTESEDFMPGWEHRWLPLGEIDLWWDWGAARQLVWSIVPAFPFSIWHNLGLRWQL